MFGWSAAAPKRVLAGVVSLLLGMSALALLAPAARADSAPAAASAGNPTTVSADGLPTVQINGVAWAQVTVGTTVYVTGSFSTARPAGAAAGTQETPRANLLAYDIRTGNLITTWAPSLNAQGKAIAASPDGTRIYVGGDFTVAGGQVRNRVAAFDAATGALIANFAPSASGQVRAIAATNTTVYLGGSFGGIGSVSRTRLAAVSASTGALLPWAPVPGYGSTAGNTDGNKTQTNEVLAIVVTGNGAQVVVAGRFASLNGVASNGVGAVDPTSGATRPFAMGQLLTNQGNNSAVWSLSTDGTNVYGTAYNLAGPGNLEGTFAADPNGGAPVWVNSCWGDSYSSYATGGAIYIASHSHNCSDVSGFPQENPTAWHFGTAYSTAPTGKLGGFRIYGNAWMHTAAASVLDWYPTLNQGSYTGQYQAGWSVTGSGGYVAYGGEFTKVNGVGQQGLVRFALPSIAPNKIGPVSDATSTPVVTSLATGTARVAWTASYDNDNAGLTYRVTRSDQPATVVYQTTADSSWWDRPSLGFVDSGVRPGSTYTYTVTAVDAFGNSASRTSAAFTVPAAVADGGAYAATVLADDPAHYWRLDEPAGTGRSYDQVGVEDLALGATATPTTGGLAGSSDGALSLDGTVTSTIDDPNQGMAPNTYSIEGWFSTRSTTGGVLFSFGDTQTNYSLNHDRYVYLNNNGTVGFGVWPGWSATLTSARSYNDGSWHHVVAELGPNSLQLYMDGQLVGSRTDVSSGQIIQGYWRIGGDARWAGNSDWFAGKVDEVALYPAQLTADQVQRHYTAGRTGVRQNLAPQAAFSSSSSGLTATFTGAGSTDPDGTISRYSWNFGDGSTGTGASVTHTYAKAGSYRATLTVTDNGGATGAASRAVTVAATGTGSSAYSRAVLAGGASSYWRLDEASGSGIDQAGTDDLAIGTGVRRGTAGAVAGDPDASSTFNGTSAGYASTLRQQLAPDTFTVELWFRTTSTVGGKLLGFGDATSGLSPDYDRHLYLDPSGRLTFGVWPQVTRSLMTPNPVNDGRWHQVVGSLGADGMSLYLDGQLVGSRTDATAGQVIAGYWRIGGDQTWAGAQWFTGDIDDVSVYPSVLSAAQVAQHYGLATGGAANAAPTAAFTSTTAYLDAAFDGSASADRDGSVRGWAWSFGDGTTGSGATAAHTYTAAGTYTVRLTVTDDAGATASSDRSVTVTAPPPNQAPTAAFTATATGLTVSVDGSGSTDADGSVRSSAWTFGDGGSGTGPTASHTYAAAGTYPVKLTVTDDDGATATSTQQVTVTAPTGAPLVAGDTFDRSVTGGLGTATVGGAWTASAGAARQSVTPGAAELRLDTANSNTGSYLSGVSRTGTDVLTTFSLSSAPTGSGTYVYVSGRRVAGAGEYRVRVRVMPDGRVALALSRLVGTTESFPGGETVVPGLTWTPGTPLTVRVDVVGTGTTTVRATVWAAGTAEPATPSITRTDTTAALQAAGGIGLSVHRPTDSTTATAVRFTGLTVTAAA